jgi:hypothetical protein
MSDATAATILLAEEHDATRAFPQVIWGRLRGVVDVAEFFRSGPSGPLSAVRHRCRPRPWTGRGDRGLVSASPGARLP